MRGYRAATGLEIARSPMYAVCSSPGPRRVAPLAAGFGPLEQPRPAGATPTRPRPGSGWSGPLEVLTECKVITVHIVTGPARPRPGSLCQIEQMFAIVTSQTIAAIECVVTSQTIAAPARPGSLCQVAARPRPGPVMSTRPGCFSYELRGVYVHPVRTHCTYTLSVHPAGPKFPGRNKIFFREILTFPTNNVYVHTLFTRKKKCPKFLLYVRACTYKRIEPGRSSNGRNAAGLRTLQTA